eukprot:TRINITY_DN13559_c0_g1_i1.p1 TRINITY_DN13559_c0_g1~~TRINITY_DN13559_c0_g1_i1.p1  ORF type:complete len:942 (+),score=96.07 TRINITY_DN13559_c0_g1_i1:544-3369(+)
MEYNRVNSSSSCFPDRLVLRCNSSRILFEVKGIFSSSTLPLTYDNCLSSSSTSNSTSSMNDMFLHQEKVYREINDFFIHADRAHAPPSFSSDWPPYSPGLLIGFLVMIARCGVRWKRLGDTAILPHHHRRHVEEDENVNPAHVGNDDDDDYDERYYDKRDWVCSCMLREGVDQIYSAMHHIHLVEKVVYDDDVLDEEEWIRDEVNNNGGDVDDYALVEYDAIKTSQHDKSKHSPVYVSPPFLVEIAESPYLEGFRGGSYDYDDVLHPAPPQLPGHFFMNRAYHYIQLDEWPPKVIVTNITLDALEYSRDGRTIYGQARSLRRKGMSSYKEIFKFSSFPPQQNNIIDSHRIDRGDLHCVVGDFAIYHYGFSENGTRALYKSNNVAFSESDRIKNFPIVGLVVDDNVYHSHDSDWGVNPPSLSSSSYTHDDGSYYYQRELGSWGDFAHYKFFTLPEMFQKRKDDDAHRFGRKKIIYPGMGRDAIIIKHRVFRYNPEHRDEFWPMRVFAGNSKSDPVDMFIDVHSSPPMLHRPSSFPWASSSSSPSGYEYRYDQNERCFFIQNGRLKEIVLVSDLVLGIVDHDCWSQVPIKDIKDAGSAGILITNCHNFFEQGIACVIYSPGILNDDLTISNPGIIRVVNYAHFGLWDYVPRHGDCPLQCVVWSEPVNMLVALVKLEVEVVDRVELDGEAVAGVHDASNINVDDDDDYNQQRQRYVQQEFRGLHIRDIIRIVPASPCTVDKTLAYAAFDPHLYLPTSLHLTTPYMNIPPMASDSSIIAKNNSAMSLFRSSICAHSISRARKWYTSESFSDFAVVCAWERSPGEMHHGLFSENCKVFSDLALLLSQNLGAMIAYRTERKNNKSPFVYKIATVLDFVCQSPLTGEIRMCKQKGSYLYYVDVQLSLESFLCVGVLAPVPRADATKTHKLGSSTMRIVKQKNGAIIWL